MKKIAGFILIFVILASCQNIEKTPKPKDLISEDKMVEVLTDMTLMQSARNFNKQQFEKTGFTPKNFIYEKYGIDSLQFERSNNYYAEKYTIYEGVYRRVKDSLEVLKVKMDSIRDEEIRLQDSTNIANKFFELMEPEFMKYVPQLDQKPKLEKPRSSGRTRTPVQNDSLKTPVSRN
jgi:hypothetical protein